MECKLQKSLVLTHEQVFIKLVPDTGSFHPEKRHFRKLVHHDPAQADASRVMDQSQGHFPANGENYEECSIDSNLKRLDQDFLLAPGVRYLTFWTLSLV